MDTHRTNPGAIATFCVWGSFPTWDEFSTETREMAFLIEEHLYRLAAEEAA